MRRNWTYVLTRFLGNVNFWGTWYQVSRGRVEKQAPPKSTVRRNIFHLTVGFAGAYFPYVPWGFWIKTSQSWHFREILLKRNSIWVVQEFRIAGNQHNPPIISPPLTGFNKALYEYCDVPFKTELALTMAQRSSTFKRHCRCPDVCGI